MFGREFQDQIKRVLSPMVKGLITTWGSKFTASSFKAFVTRDGIHQPKNGAYLNMTEELLRLVEKDVEPMHVEIAQIIDEKIELIIKKTTAMFDTIERQFDTSEHLGGVDMQNFMECFHQERITALAEVGAQAMALKRTLRKMHNDALEARPVSRRYPSSNSAQQQPQPLRQPSPFVTRMSEIYVEVSRMAGGKGSHNKRIQRFSSLVASSSTAWGPFPRLCDHLVQALSAPLGDFIGEKIVKGCIDATLDRVLQDLNIRFECGAGEAEGGGRRSEVNGELDEAARAELKIALADCVDRCKDVMESKLPALIYGDGHEFGGGTGSTSAIWSS
ncbi:hypothetical protein AAFC00_005209 [Neodothiora populina]|uniref:DUF7605 domain-containing protein n=1 Tax=Neodothiora populina TaxID=2781224 RepID=A0ABR3PKD2_9PEZI